MSCTTILVGKNASWDGSTMMARNEDSGSNHFDPKKFIVVKPEEQPRVYVSKISKVRIELPEDPMRYTAMPNAIDNEGIWGECGFNTCNVAMTATETITSNARVQGADPLVSGGIGEEDLLTIVLPYIHSAREGVERLGKLLETYGTYEKNGIGFQDRNEVWWFESVGGHHFIAKRVPDDEYIVNPNQMGIDCFDFVDAFGLKRDHICSEDMLSFVERNHLDLSFHEEPLSELRDFDARAAFGSHDDSDHSYNTPRAWYMLKTLNPTTWRWEGENADYTPFSDDLPWSMIPEKKVTVEDIKYVLSSHYQGTEYDPYSIHTDSARKGMLRPIGVNRTNFLGITVLRPDVPEEISAVQWIAVGSNVFNAAVPFYANVNETPAYLASTDARVTTENFYWENRILGAIADAHYQETALYIERYQNAVHQSGHALLNRFDSAYEKGINVPVTEYLEACNREIAGMAKEKTDAVLDNVLREGSFRMKNAYTRADA